MDRVIQTKADTAFQNNKPWVTNELKEILNEEREREKKRKRLLHWRGGGKKRGQWRGQAIKKPSLNIKTEWSSGLRGTSDVLGRALN